MELNQTPKQNRKYTNYGDSCNAVVLMLSGGGVNVISSIYGSFTTIAKEGVNAIPSIGGGFTTIVKKGVNVTLQKHYFLGNALTLFSLKPRKQCFCRYSVDAVNRREQSMNSCFSPHGGELERGLAYD